MEGSFVRLYVSQKRRHRGAPLWEWLLRSANSMGIRGGSAFHASAGFGRHHTLHEDHFFELGGSQVVEVEFIVTAQERRTLFDLLEREGVRVFFADIAARFGMTGPEQDDGGR